MEQSQLQTNYQIRNKWQREETKIINKLNLLCDEQNHHFRKSSLQRVSGGNITRFKMVYLITRISLSAMLTMQLCCVVKSLTVTLSLIPFSLWINSVVDRAFSDSCCRLWESSVWKMENRTCIIFFLLQPWCNVCDACCWFNFQ